MNKPYIEFNRERDFGEIFNATFTFISQNFKHMGKAILYYALPFMLFTSILMSSVYSDMFGVVFNPLSNISGPFLGNYFLILLVYIAGYTILIGTIYGYISLYVKHGRDGFTMGDILVVIKMKFFSIFFANIVCAIIMGIGTILLIIPGIYLGVSMSLILFVLVYEDKGFGHAFSRSFELTHKNWWWVLLLLLVMYILIYIVNLLFSIPQLIITGLTAFHVASGQSSPDYTLLYTILSVINYLISSILSTIPFIALAFQYFSIVERTESPALIQKVQEIGQDETTIQ